MMKEYEVKNFELSYNGGYEITWGNLSMPVYLDIITILKMLKIEGLSIEDVENKLKSQKPLIFNKVILVLWSNENNYGSRFLLYDFNELYPISNRGMLKVDLKEVSETMDVDITYNRVDKFTNAITNFSPFTKLISNGQDKLSYRNFKLFKEYFKMGISFKPDGSASLVLENHKYGVFRNNNMIDTLKKIKLEQEFSNKAIAPWREKHFDIGNPYESMTDVDNALIQFVQKLLNEFRKYIENKNITI